MGNKLETLNLGCCDAGESKIDTKQQENQAEIEKNPDKGKERRAFETLEQSAHVVTTQEQKADVEVKASEFNPVRAEAHSETQPETLPEVQPEAQLGDQPETEPEAAAGS